MAQHQSTQVGSCSADHMAAKWWAWAVQGDMSGVWAVMPTGGVAAAPEGHRHRRLAPCGCSRCCMRCRVGAGGILPGRMYLVGWLVVSFTSRMSQVAATWAGHRHTLGMPCSVVLVARWPQAASGSYRL
jgi:hypothetical protein